MRFGVLLAVLIVIIGVISFVVVKPFGVKEVQEGKGIVPTSPQEAAIVEEVTEQEETADTPVQYSIILPTLTYLGAYNGPLYATSEQIGDNYPIGKYMANLDRNGVNWFIGFFTFDKPQEGFLSTSNGLGYVITAVKRYPGRIIPYYNPGLGGEEAEPLVGDKLTAQYSATLGVVKEIAGDGFIQGLGEIEAQEWGVAHNNPKVLQLFDLAKVNGIDAMFHPVASKIAQVGQIAEAYPSMKFIIHMYRSDLSKSRSQLIEILKTHDNIFYSIDAAHVAHYDGMDIVYDLEKSTIQASKSAFISEFDSKYDSMLSAAVSAYKPLVEGAPDKVMWGTEMGPDYSYEPEVYDRMVKISRELIGKMGPEHQEGLGYKNALRVYGEGLVFTTDVTVFDTSSWPICTGSQMSSCDLQCGIAESQLDTDPEAEKCFQTCLVTIPCIDNFEED